MVNVKERPQLASSNEIGSRVNSGAQSISIDLPGKRNSSLIDIRNADKVPPKPNLKPSKIVWMSGDRPVNGGGNSDVTLKENIDYFGSGILKKIIALKPVRWNWKDKEEGAEMQYGFIAQDVEKVIPHLVSEGVWKDGTKKKRIKTTDMIPYLVSAIKEQQDQIITLQKLVNKLQAKKKSAKSKAN